MKVIGLLSWFEERPSWLAACVSSMSKLCSHVVAFDGAYARFPALHARSSPEQAETIIRTADGLGMDWTLHSPHEKWWGGEVSKRAALLRAGSVHADEDDWFLILDADEVLLEASSETHAQLTDTDMDVGEVQMTDGYDGVAPIRRLFRALPNITTEQAHYVVTASKAGRKVVLCGNPSVHTQEPALAVPDVRIMHLSAERDPERRQQKAEYYSRAMPVETESLEVFADA